MPGNTAVAQFYTLGPEWVRRRAQIGVTAAFFGPGSLDLFRAFGQDQSAFF
jgi:hypothetical protein